MLLQEGVFTNLIDDVTVYVRARDSSGNLHGILVHDSRVPDQPVTMMAERGALVSTPKGPRFVLINGNRQEMQRDGRKLNLLYFDRYSLDLSNIVSVDGPRWREPRERYIHELFREAQDDGERAYINELRGEGHTRLVSPLYSPVMTLIAMVSLLGGEFNRRGRSGRMIITGVIAVAFQGLALGLTYAIVKMPLLTPLPYVNVILWTGAGLYLLLIRNHPRRQPAGNHDPGEVSVV